MVKRGEILKRELRNKRGMEMTFATLVIIVLSIILLALLITFLTGNFSKFKDKLDTFWSSSNVDMVVENCNNLVMQSSDYEYCCVNKTVKLSSKQKFEASCNFLVSGNYSWAKDIEELNCEGVC